MFRRWNTWKANVIRADEHKLMRRVAGTHDIRLDGVVDILSRCDNASVLDLGCNRGAVSYEFAKNGATLCHGCDIYEPGLAAAREYFIDLRKVEFKFEVADLTRGPEALAVFGGQTYDIVLMLATYHKIKRHMPADTLRDLIKYVANRTKRYFVWRGPAPRDESNEEIAALDAALIPSGFERVQTSYLSTMIGPAAIWAK